VSEGNDVRSVRVRGCYRVSEGEDVRRILEEEDVGSG